MYHVLDFYNNVNNNSSIARNAVKSPPNIQILPGDALTFYFALLFFSASNNDTVDLSRDFYPKQLRHEHCRRERKGPTPLNNNDYE